MFRRIIEKPFLILGSKKGPRRSGAKVSEVNSDVQSQLGRFARSPIRSALPQPGPEPKTVGAARPHRTPTLSFVDHKNFFTICSKTRLNDDLLTGR